MTCGLFLMSRWTTYVCGIPMRANVLFSIFQNNERATPTFQNMVSFLFYLFTINRSCALLVFYNTIEIIFRLWQLIVFIKSGEVVILNLDMILVADVIIHERFIRCLHLKSIAPTWSIDHWVNSYLSSLVWHTRLSCSLLRQSLKYSHGCYFSRPDTVIFSDISYGNSVVSICSCI